MSDEVGLYFEDFVIDKEYESPGRTITETDLVMYAGLSGDYNQLHTDEDYSKKVSMYGRRIFHGLFGLTLVEGLKSRVGLFEGTSMASLEWRWTFKKALFIGDTVRVKWKIIKKKETSKPDRGVITEFLQLVNQNDEVTAEGEHVVMMRRRPTGA